MPIVVDTHLLGSRAGYRTIAKSGGIEAAEERELAVLGFGQVSDRLGLEALLQAPSAFGRRLTSGRFAVTRVLPGPADDAGRPTLELRSVVMAPQSYLGLCRSGLMRLVGTGAVWSDAAFADGRAMTLAEPPASGSTATEAHCRLADAWLAVAGDGRRMVRVEDSPQARERILEVAGFLHPHDLARYRWGIGLLATTVPVDLCTLAPGGAETGRRLVQRMDADAARTWQRPDLAELVGQRGWPSLARSAASAVAAGPSPWDEAEARGGGGGRRRLVAVAAALLLLGLMSVIVVLALPRRGAAPPSPEFATERGGRERPAPRDDAPPREDAAAPVVDGREVVVPPGRGGGVADGEDAGRSGEVETVAADSGAVGDGGEGVSEAPSQEAHGAGDLGGRPQREVVVPPGRAGVGVSLPEPPAEGGQAPVETTPPPDGDGGSPGGDAEGRESAAPSVRPTPPPRRPGSEDRNGPSNPQGVADAGPDGALRGDDRGDAGGEGAEAEPEMVCDCDDIRADLEGRLDQVRGWSAGPGSEESRRANWRQLLEPIRAASEVLKRSLDGTTRRGDRFRIVESLCTVGWAAERAFHGSAGAPGMSRLFIQQFGPSLDLQMQRWHDPIAELFAAVNRVSTPRLAEPSPHFLFRPSVQETPRGGPSQGQAPGRRQSEPAGVGMRPLASSDATVLRNLADRLRARLQDMVGPSGRAPDPELAACIATAFPSPQARRDAARGGDAAAHGDPNDAGTAVDPDPSGGDEPPDSPIPSDAGGAAPRSADPPPDGAAPQPPSAAAARTPLDSLP